MALKVDLDNASLAVVRYGYVFQCNDPLDLDSLRQRVESERELDFRIGTRNNNFSTF